MTVTGKTIYNLEKAPIGSGGEGDIYNIIAMNYVAKIYRPGVLSEELEKKLEIMIKNPPNESVLSQVAWPIDMAYDNNGQCLGFIMPKLNMNVDLSDVYKYPPMIDISAYQKIVIAQNICVVIKEVHKAGYIFGDFNPRNIGLDKNTGFVSFLDTDTYHVADNLSGKTYRCNVCAPGYSAPELLEKCSDYIANNPSDSKDAYAKTPLPTFTQETDNFALAIHIFKLLMNGFTPFGGITETAPVSQSSPGVGDSAVRRDSYCFKPGNKHQSTAILPPEALPQEIIDLFNRAFIEGKLNPHRRPTSVEWYEALERLEQSLAACSRNPLHHYYSKNSECPLCAADRRYGAVTQQTVIAPAPTIVSSIQASQSPVQVPNSSINSSILSHTQTTKNSPVYIIRESRKRIRRLSTIFSIILWTCTAIAYFAISYQLGYTTLSLNLDNTSGAWIIFVFAALIGCGVELLFSHRELKVLTETIDLRELKSGSGVEVELREYKVRLTTKIRIFFYLFAILLIASFFVMLYN